MSLLGSPHQSLYGFYSASTTNSVELSEPAVVTRSRTPGLVLGMGGGGISSPAVVRKGLGERADLPPDRPDEELRKRYLHQAGFARDIFAFPVAEKEYAFAERLDLRVSQVKSPRTTSEQAATYRSWMDAVSPVVPRDTLSVEPQQKVAGEPTPPAEKTPPPTPQKPMFSPRVFFTDPVYSSRTIGSVFADLRHSRHTFVMGRPGDGKTTMRLALEAHVRTQPEATLIVTYKPGYDSVGPTLEAHLTRLMQAVAVDLFVQVVEQFGYREERPSDKQEAALRRLLPYGGPGLRRALSRLVEEEAPAPIWGFAELWRLVDRPIVRPVVRTELLREWLRRLLAGLERADRTLTPGAQWQQAIDAARLCGFERIFITVDGIDTWRRSRDRMMALLRPLLQATPKFTAHNIYLKCFLPLELQPAISKQLKRAKLSPDEAEVIDLSWSPERLRALLHTRYMAGGSRRVSLVDLVEPELEDIDDRLISAADGSPRRLLTLLDQLINVHISRGPIERPITGDEWWQAVVRTERVLAGQ